MNITYYDILELQRNASQDDIKKSYRRLAKIYHPDKTNGDKIKEQKFKEISDAYNILSDKQKKEEYDIKINQKNNQHDEYTVNKDYFDIFNNINKIYNITSTRKIGNNITINKDIEFEKINEPIEINYKRYIKCEKCDGIGYSSYSTCKNCKGTGYVGHIIKNKCDRCDNGIVYDKNTMCDSCNGHGYHFVNDKIYINYSNDKIILHKRGDYIKFGEYGDLIINFNIKSIKDFKTNGKDLYKDINIPIYNMIFGCDILINHPNKKLKIKIPKNTENNTTMRIKGMGIKNEGDLYITIYCNVPKLENLSDNEISILETSMDKGYFKK